MTRIPDFEIRDAAPGCGAFELVLGGFWQFEPERKIVENYLVRVVNEHLSPWVPMMATGQNLRALEQIAASRLYHLVACGDLRELRRDRYAEPAWHLEGSVNALWGNQ